jgi:hypothetical protein
VAVNDSHHIVPTTSSRKTRDRTACAKQRLDPNQLRREMRAVEIAILDKANAWQIVLLRDPLMLPRPDAIT